MNKLDSAAIERSKISVGNPTRLARVMQKAQNGEPITIGYLGGSITEGFFASKPELNYASRITSWWQGKFPQSAVSMINAGIGATGSVIGTFRVKEHLLDHKPDVVVIEFAVNDTGDYEIPSKEAYESTVRQCLKAGAAVLLVFTLLKDGGRNRQDEEIVIGRHYDLPMISVRDAVWPQMECGERLWEEYSNDAVHPNDNGHEIVASLVTNVLDEIYTNIDAANDELAPLPVPLTTDTLESGCLLDHRRITAEKLGGFVLHEKGFEHFHYAWFAENGGDELVFEVENCKVLMLMLMKEPHERAGTAHITATVNDITSTFDFDASFPGGWGGCARCVQVHRSDDEPQTVRVSIKPEKTVMLMQVLKA